MKRVMRIVALFLVVTLMHSSNLSFSDSFCGYCPSAFSDDNIVEMIQQVNESLVFYYLDNLMEFGSRYTGSENCSRAAEYIYNEFHQMGLWVQFKDWDYAGYHSRNVVATLNGTDLSSNAIFIMSAHYDTTPDSLGGR